MDQEMQELLKSVADTQARQADIMETLAKGNGDEQKTVGTVQSAGWLHGSLGIFSTAGLDREVISTHVRSYGLGAALPKLPSVFEDPRYGALTGVSDDVGNEPANPCNDAPTGYVKACNLQAQFGRVARDTETIEMDKLMLRQRRSDFTDLRLIGQMMGDSGFAVGNLNQQQMLNLVTMKEMIGVGVRMERKLSDHLWSGNPANNNLGGGYKEFPGLALQVNTGQVDADTNTSCPSLDSDVKDFNYNDVCGTTVDIVEYMSMLEYYIYELASDTGMLPTQWVWVMRPQLWYELTACWPCKYNTNRCTSIGGDHQVITDGRENISERDRMRDGLTIDVNGRTYPVILDNSMPELSPTDNANLIPGQYASNIYFLPMTITGNFPVLYMEYLDYRQAASDVALLRGREDFWTDGGMWSWAIENLNWCFKLKLKSEQRVVLRTPQLAGRIDNVRYTPLQHLRDPQPTSPYWSDGGVSLRETATDYAVWLGA
jgi:hypothetical protein